jgi:hypothetical protein
LTQLVPLVIRGQHDHKWEPCQKRFIGQFSGDLDVFHLHSQQSVLKSNCVALTRLFFDNCEVRRRCGAAKLRGCAQHSLTQEAGGEGGYGWLRPIPPKYRPNTAQIPPKYRLLPPITASKK